MKKLSLLLFFFGLMMLHAQNTRVIYEYKFVPDKTKQDSISTEWMYLDIAKEGSKYYSKRKFESDSITLESIKKQLATGSRNLSISQSRSMGDVQYSVEKTYPDYKIFLNTSIDHDKYRVAEDRTITWKILGEKDKIETYNVQKATADFGGRQWTAWFTTEIPVQDGPYKFHGLPGLILKMEDATKTHSIVMKGLKKFGVAKADELSSDKVPAFYNRKPLDVTRKQYNAQWEKYRQDPVQGLREMMNMPNSKVKVNINGREFSDPKEVLREMEKSAKEEMQRDNNRIELQP